VEYTQNEEKTSKSKETNGTTKKETKTRQQLKVAEFSEFFVWRTALKEGSLIFEV
jgi:hypothetical protein